MAQKWPKFSPNKAFSEPLGGPNTLKMGLETYYEYLEVCQGDFEIFDFSRNNNQFSADFGWFSDQNQKCLRFFF